MVWKDGLCLAAALSYLGRNQLRPVAVTEVKDVLGRRGKRVLEGERK